jgi:hypothetical protein
MGIRRGTQQPGQLLLSSCLPNPTKSMRTNAMTNKPTRRLSAEPPPSGASGAQSPLTPLSSPTWPGRCWRRSARPPTPSSGPNGKTVPWRQPRRSGRNRGVARTPSPSSGGKECREGKWRNQTNPLSPGTCLNRSPELVLVYACTCRHVACPAFANASLQHRADRGVALPR